MAATSNSMLCGNGVDIQLLSSSFSRSKGTTGGRSGTILPLASLTTMSAVTSTAGGLTVFTAASGAAAGRREEACGPNKLRRTEELLRDGKCGARGSMLMGTGKPDLACSESLSKGATV